MMPYTTELNLVLSAYNPAASGTTIVEVSLHCGEISEADSIFQNWAPTMSAPTGPRLWAAANPASFRKEFKPRDSGSDLNIILGFDDMQNCLWSV